MFDLTDWKLIFTFGTSGLVFANGNHRILFDKFTAELICEWDFIPEANNA